METDIKWERITYHNGTGQEPFRAIAGVSINPASGNGIGYDIYIAKNGTIILSSRKTILVDNGKMLEITMFADVQMTNNDFLEIYIACNTGTTNVTGFAGQLSVGK